MGTLSALTAVVTGGNGGLGLGLAEGIAAAGGNVAIWARNVERSADAVRHLESFGVRAEAFACDITSEVDVANAAVQTIERFGKIDILFANAGVADAAPFIDTSLEDWTRVFDTNMTGTFLTTREVARHLVRRGAGGSIVVVSSMVTSYGAAQQAAYAASKSGCASLGRTLAVELARYKIRCNILTPGWTETSMNAHLRTNPTFFDVTTKRTPVRRWGTPDDFRSVAAYLADPSLTFHTGDEIRLDGAYALF